MSKFCCCLLTVLIMAALEQVQLQAQPTTDIPAGSVVEAKLVETIDAKKSKAGDEVTAKVTRDVNSGDRIVIAKGSKIVGKLTDVKVKSQDQKQSVVTIAFDHAVLKDGSELPLIVTIQALSKPADDRTLDLSDSMRGTAPNTSAGSLEIKLPLMLTGMVNQKSLALRAKESRDITGLACKTRASFRWLRMSVWTAERS